MMICKYILKFTFKFRCIIYTYVLIWIFIMLQSYSIYTLKFVFDVNPYFYQLLSSALDHKGGNELSVLLS